MKLKIRASKPKYDLDALIEKFRADGWFVNLSNQYLNLSPEDDFAKVDTWEYYSPRIAIDYRHYVYSRGSDCGLNLRSCTLAFNKIDMVASQHLLKRIYSKISDLDELIENSKELLTLLKKLNILMKASYEA